MKRKRFWILKTVLEPGNCSISEASLVSRCSVMIQEIFLGLLLSWVGFCCLQLKVLSPTKTLFGVGARTRGFLSSADMDLGVLLESPQGSQSSSRVGACTCAFLPSCSSSVTLPFAWIKGSVAFPRGFPHQSAASQIPVLITGISISSAKPGLRCLQAMLGSLLSFIRNLTSNQSSGETTKPASFLPLQH